MTIKRGRVTVAKRSSRVTARGKTTKFRLKFTKAGKRLLRRGRTFRARGVLVAPGVDTKRVRIKFRR